MAAPGDGERPRCPNCGAAHEPDAVTCPLCGDPLPTAPVDALVEELEDLKSTANGALAEDLEALEEAVVVEAEAVDQTLGELQAVEEEVAITEERLQEEERDADLSEFVRRVEETVTARAHVPAPPPRRSPAGTALLAIGGLVSVTGLFLIPAALPIGAFTFLGGVLVGSVGALIRFGPPRRQ